MIGKQLAHFEILAKIGEGGMGVVYQARDTKLGRDVALKVLPPTFLQDGERLARFRREAKVLASLNHANIASIYGLEESEGQLFLVMELAQGEDLSQRLSRGAIAPEETLAIARQIIAGLEEAHENSVVHRDLKPANIKLSDDGKVKILDFGLARAWAEDPAADSDLANSPTITAAMTQAGVILGTAAYMSPEQARGKIVDRRADIWSLGVILFEMLTGRRLFEGETVSDTLAGVLKTDVDFEGLPDDTPASLRWLIARSLQRHPEKRLRDIGEARIALDGGDPHLSMSWSAPMALEQDSRGWPRVALFVALALIVGAGTTWFLRPQAEPARGIHASLLAPEGSAYELGTGGHFALSHDGTQLAFTARDSMGTASLWVRRLDVAAPFQLSGTAGASYPFWSPDGTSIGFFADDKMKKIAAGGGVATTICPAPIGRGGSWMENDEIVFAPNNRSELRIVSAGGGEPRAVTTLDSLETSHRWPNVLPDQKHVLMSARTEEGYDLEIASLETGERSVLLPKVLSGTYAEGHVFFSRDGALWARPFDPDRREFIDKEFLVSEAVVGSGMWGKACFATSEEGTLAFATTNLQQSSYLARVNASGVESFRYVSTEGEMDYFDLSPDERFLVMRVNESESEELGDIWVYDLRRSTVARFTTGEDGRTPLWSPDGSRIAYLRGANQTSLVIREFRGSREVVLDFPIDSSARLHDWSPDGRLIYLTMLPPQAEPGSGSRTTYILPVDSPETMYRLGSGDYFHVHGKFSPDSRWILYMSLRTGTAQAYLREVDPDGEDIQVSTTGGREPSFSAAGDKIYFAWNDFLQSVDVDWNGSIPELGLPVQVAQLPMRTGYRITHQYLVTRDGDFFIFADPSSSGIAQATLDVMVGWKRLLGVN